MAETSSIEGLSKIKISASIEVYGKNATLANFQPVKLNQIELLGKVASIFNEFV